MGLLDPKTSVSGEPRNSGLELVFDEDCIDNPLLLQADYAEVNALWYSALDDQQDLTAGLAKWREFFRAQWLEMTDEQKILYLMSRKARPLILKARAEPAKWKRDDDDRHGPAVLVAGGGSFKSSFSKLGELCSVASNLSEKDRKTMEIDHFEFPAATNSLIKSERVMPGAHHDELTPVLPVLNLFSPDAEIMHPAEVMTVRVITPVRN